MGAPALRPATSSTTRNASFPPIRSGNSTSTRRTRSWKRPGARPADRPQIGRGSHLWAHRRCDRQLPQQPETLRFHQYEVGIQHRQGEPDPGRGQALGLLIDRKSVADHIYGRTGVATGNFLNNPKRFVSTNTKWEFNIDKANQILEEAGWKKGSDGIRAKDGKKLKFVYQTSINPPRQKNQPIAKQARQTAGI